MHKFEVFNKDDFQRCLDERLISEATHKETGMKVYKYTVKTVYSRAWNDTTMRARGIVFDKADNLVGHGFKKFFNFSEHPEGSVDVHENALIMDKLDGSNGIVFHSGGKWWVSTPGSLSSDQAVYATELMRNRYGHIKPVEGYTMLVEIIAPQFRIVTDYGEKDDLVLLGAMSDSGEWVSPEDARDMFGWTGEVVSSRRGAIIDALQAKDPGDLTEGFVVRADSGLMVKVKYPTYLQAHRARFLLNRKSVLEALREGTEMETLAVLPNEFHDEFNALASEIKSEHKSLSDEVGYWVDKVPADLDRGGKARWVNANVDDKVRSLVMTKAVAGKDITDAIWRNIR